MSFPTKPLETTFATFALLRNRSEAAAKEAHVSDTVENVYVIGWIEFIDDAGNKRQIEFCRIYDFKTKRFCKYDDPDYEYEG